MSTVREGIAQFLNNRQAESPYLIPRYTTSLETQVNVREAAKELSEDDDSENPTQQKHNRWPWKAGSNPQYKDCTLYYSPGEHCTRIGSTWWNWETRRSVAACFDIDVEGDGHAESTNKVSLERRDEIIEMLKSVGYVTLVRSSGGNGVHGYVFFNVGDQPVALTHGEHMQIGKLVVQKISDDIGYDLVANKVIDAKGMVLWLWSCDSPADHSGYTLIHEATTQIGATDLPPVEEIAVADGKPLDPTKPGDAFAMAASWEEILEPHGWKSCGGNTWTRPGKDTGVSASTTTVSKQGRQLFRCFTSGAPPLQENKTYNKFGLYAVLNHDGDHNKAARALLEQGYGEKKRKANTAQKAVKEVLCLVEDKGDALFHDRSGLTYATYRHQGHAETAILAGEDYNLTLRHRYRLQSGVSIMPTHLNHAMQELRAMATFEGPEKETNIRYAECGGKIYVDLCDKERRCVEIDASGYRVIDGPPDAICFRRPQGMLPLPLPEDGGTFDDFRKIIRVQPEDFPLAMTALVSHLRPGRDAAAAVAFCSDAGNGKTSNARHFRGLIDPNVVDLLGPKSQKKSDDIMLAALNSWQIGFDNLSSLSSDMSDLLCTIITGTGQRKRKLYADCDEIIFNVRRPIVMSSIARVIEKSDLASRALVFDVPGFQEADRQLSEEKLAELFEALRPALLGYLYGAMSTVLRDQTPVAGGVNSRMSGLVSIANAVEPYFSQPAGSIVSRIHAAQSELQKEIAGENTLVQALRSIGPFVDLNANQILKELVDTGFNYKSDANYLSRELKMLSKSFQAVGCCLTSRALNGYTKWSLSEAVAA